MSNKKNRSEQFEAVSKKGTGGTGNILVPCFVFCYLCLKCEAVKIAKQFNLIFCLFYGVFFTNVISQ